MEYKVIDLQAMREKVKEAGEKVGFFSNPTDPDSWETTLNAYAREGWTVITSHVWNTENNDDIIIILGRPI
tara:strand:+ start:148 stop:360 length:213 start_codon:yes stop_codon:yes gene_type:complete